MGCNLDATLTPTPTPTPDPTISLSLSLTYRIEHDLPLFHLLEVLVAFPFVIFVTSTASHRVKLLRTLALFCPPHLFTTALGLVIFTLLRALGAPEPAATLTYI